MDRHWMIGMCAFGLFSVADAVRCIYLDHDDWPVPFACAIFAAVGVSRIEVNGI